LTLKLLDVTERQILFVEPKPMTGWRRPNPPFF